MWSKTKTKYYGSQYGKTANPTNLLEGRYQTSSKYVHEFWKENGPPDVITIHRTFDSVQECREFEHQYLRRVGAAKSDGWLNRTDNRAIHTDNYNPMSWKSSHESRRKHLQEDDEFRKQQVSKFVQLMHTVEASEKRKATFQQTQHSKGENNPRFGIAATPELKQKISFARKQQVEFNKQRGQELNQQRYNCPHCGKVNLNGGNYRRWHGDNCSSK